MTLSIQDTLEILGAEIPDVPSTDQLIAFKLAVECVLNKTEENESGN